MDIVEMKLYIPASDTDNYRLYLELPDTLLVPEPDLEPDPNRNSLPNFPEKHGFYGKAEAGNGRTSYARVFVPEVPHSERWEAIFKAVWEAQWLVQDTPECSLTFSLALQDFVELKMSVNVGSLDEWWSSPS
jgi:hypothetical protein